MYSIVLIEKKKKRNAKEKRIVVIGGLVCKRGRECVIDKRLEFYFCFFFPFFLFSFFSRERKKEK